MAPHASHSSHRTDTRRGAPRRASLRAILLATSALAASVLPTTVAHAIDATWAPGDNNFNNDANWKDAAGGASTTPDGTATFNANSGQPNVQFTAGITTVGGIAVTSGDYTFDTLGHDVTFNGAGLAVGSGATLKFDVKDGLTTFEGHSTADHAQIAVGAGGQLLFTGAGADNSSAASATITNSGTLSFESSSTAASATIINHVTLTFDNNSSAGNAFIDSDGSIAFSGNADGGTARIKLDAGGSLGFSALITPDATIGSLEGNGGTVTLANHTLTVGGNGRTTTFSGVIENGFGFADGSLIKEGAGTLTLTATSSYFGHTVVIGGALIVDGDISTSSDVIVGAHSTLGGTGTVSGTTIDGGTLAPGHDDGHGVLTGTLNVKGDLQFNTTAGSTYLVQVTPTTSTSTSVSGGATLSNATVQALFTPGSYITKKYTILTAGNVNDNFNPLVKSNLSTALFKTSLSYDAKDVFLNLDVTGDGVVGGADGAGLNVNQRNVLNAFAHSFNLTGGMLGAFGLLSPLGYTQASGETAVGTQQATFDAMNQFMGVLLDPTRGALSGARANEAFAAMTRKAPEAFDARWGVWAAGFGGSQSTNGDTTLGSNKTTSNIFGSAVGADYRFSPDTVAGFAVAGGGTHFNVANGGSGNSDLFQAGAYVRHTEGAAFIAAALAYGWQDVTTNRTVTAFGIDSLRANFKTNALSGRLEGGYRVATAFGDITPYAAGQFTSYRLPSYMEQVAFGVGTFALNYSGKDVTASRSELGMKTEKAVSLTDATLMLRGRLAWAHDFNTDRNVQATFQSLPGSAFVVNGASPAADTALTTISAETLWRNGWSASVTADAQLSDTTHSYSGKGVVRYSW
jgi:autotransporter-associated beta strand protein